MKNAEIGQVLGISEEAVRAHISNKRKQLDKAAKTNTNKQAKKAKDE